MYIVYVTSLAILRTVTARVKLAGVTNDKESVLLYNIDTYTIHKSNAWVFEVFVLFAQAPDEGN